MSDASKQRPYTVACSNIEEYGSLTVSRDNLLVPSDFANFDSGNQGDLSGAEQEIRYLLEDETCQSLQHDLQTCYDKNSVESQKVVENDRTFLKGHNIRIFNQGKGNKFETAASSKKEIDSTAFIELTSLVFSSVPLAITFLLQSSFSTVSVFMAGNLGTVELAGVSIGSLIVSITGYAIIQGTSSALDTLCPQAFGAKNYHLVGTYLQKFVAMNCIIMIPVLFLWTVFGYGIITSFLSDKDSAKYAALYLRYTAPGIPAYILFESGKKFLEAQSIYHISTIVLLFVAPSNLIMSLIFVKKFGYIGIPMAISVDYWFIAIGLLASIKWFVKPRSTPSGMHPLICWNGLHIKNAFKDWNQIVCLAVPGLIMLEAKFFALQILTLIASYMGTVSLASQTIGTSIASLPYQILIAIGIASSTRIASFLGANSSSAAKRTTQISLCLGFIFSVLNFLVLYCFRTRIPLLFTKDDRVIKVVEGIMWLVALMQIFDAMNACSAGCLKGQGRTKIGGIVTLLSYYLVGIPLSIYLTLYSKFKGTIDCLWIGNCIALTIIGIVQIYCAIFADFTRLCTDARRRTSD